MQTADDHFSIFCLKCKKLPTNDQFQRDAKEVLPRKSAIVDIPLSTLCLSRTFLLDSVNLRFAERLNLVYCRWEESAKLMSHYKNPLPATATPAVVEKKQKIFPGPSTTCQEAIVTRSAANNSLCAWFDGTARCSHAERATCQFRTFGAARSGNSQTCCFFQVPSIFCKYRTLSDCFVLCRLRKSITAFLIYLVLFFCRRASCGISRGVKTAAVDVFSWHFPSLLPPFPKNIRFISSLMRPTWHRCWCRHLSKLNSLYLFSFCDHTSCFILSFASWIVSSLLFQTTLLKGLSHDLPHFFILVHSEGEETMSVAPWSPGHLFPGKVVIRHTSTYRH